MWMLCMWMLCIIVAERRFPGIPTRMAGGSKCITGQEKGQTEVLHQQGNYGGDEDNRYIYNRSPYYCNHQHIIL